MDISDNYLIESILTTGSNSIMDHSFSLHENTEDAIDADHVTDIVENLLIPATSP